MTTSYLLVYSIKKHLAKLGAYIESFVLRTFLLYVHPHGHMYEDTPIFNSYTIHLIHRFPDLL